MLIVLIGKMTIGQHKHCNLWLQSVRMIDHKSTQSWLLQTTKVQIPKLTQICSQDSFTLKGQRDRITHLVPVKLF